MNWGQLLLAGPDPPLGLKRLPQASKARVLVRKFIEEHPDLPLVQYALSKGEPGELVPNFADAAQRTSLSVSFFFLNELVQRANAVRGTDAPAAIDLAILGSGQEFGSRLENKLASGLRELVTGAKLPFLVASKGSADPAHTRPSFAITDYWPYTSAPTAAEDTTAREAYRRLGRGHLIQPDVLIWRPVMKPFAHVQDGHVITTGYEVRHLIACISGKATIRSDRSQSSRYEGSTISRWRRARAPYFAVVTAEPDPSRLGSLAWGLGEIDAVYHIDIASLFSAVHRTESEIGGTPAATRELGALIEHARLRDLSLLFDDIFGEFVS